jgi:ATP-dependent RNA helicase RhlE
MGTRTQAPTDKDQVTQFSDFNLSPSLQKQLASANFTTPTPVQAGAIPPALEGRDVLATAQTGTGKTLSFLIPLIERTAALKTKGAAALILLPTRELAMQVLEAYKQLTRGTEQAARQNPVPQNQERGSQSRSSQSRSSRRGGERSQTGAVSGGAALVCGGMAEGPQLDAIRRGARLIVATPGRLEDYLDRNLVNLKEVKILVLDEVDRMLDMGFQPAIRRIAAALPAERQTLCYSATLSQPIQQITREYLKNPARVEIGSVLKPSENVKLQTFEVPAEKKQELLEHLLQSSTGSFLVFVRTKHGADRVARRLSRNGHSATQIHGDRSQSQRNAALRSFAQGHHRVLVATDVAARGIDVADVAHVVNYDMPKEVEDFVHRVGRTGRASAHGIASTFAAPDEKHTMRKIERALSIPMKKFRVKANEGMGQVAMTA